MEKKKKRKQLQLNYDDVLNGVVIEDAGEILTKAKVFC